MYEYEYENTRRIKRANRRRKKQNRKQDEMIKREREQERETNRETETYECTQQKEIMIDTNRRSKQSIDIATLHDSFPFVC